MRVSGSQAVILWSSNGVPLLVGDRNNVAPATIADILDVLNIGRYDATPPTITDGRFNAFQLGSRGSLRVELRQADSNTAVSVSGLSGDTLTTTVVGMIAGAIQLAFDGTNFPRVRTPNVFKVVTLASGTAETAIWTPAGGKKFRLMGMLLTPGAASTLTFRDNTAGTIIFSARAATDTPIAPSDMGNGILSAAANNVLTVTRGTACTLDGVVWGTEE